MSRRGCIGRKIVTAKRELKVRPAELMICERTEECVTKAFLLSGVARICCEEGQIWKYYVMGHSRRTSLPDAAAAR